MATAPGLSPCTQTDAALTATTVPSTATTSCRVTIRTVPLGHLVRVVQHGVGLAPRDQGALRRVGAVGEGLGHRR